MPNHDRINELYRGEIWGPEVQEAARERIHWMCSQATGRVLDVGCSQGIASIIVAREGLRAVGIDHEISRPVHATRDLAREEIWVRRRVDFLAADGRNLPFADGSFDTVLLGEVLEHLVLPDSLLEELARVLVPGGRLVVTTPMGYHPYHDHKATFYPASLIRLVGRHFRIAGVEATERYLRLLALRQEAEAGEHDRLILGAQDDLESYMIDVERRKRTAEAREREVQRANVTLRQKLADLEERMSREQTAWREEQEAWERLRTQESATRQERRQVHAREGDRQAAKLERRVARLTEERDRARQRAGELRERLERLKWWRDAEASRRWSRMGREVSDAWGRPGRLLMLPLRLLKTLVTRQAPPPRPPSMEGTTGPERP